MADIDPMSRTVASRLANWVGDLDFDALPAEVTEVAKLLVLDQIGLQVRGAALSNVQPVLDLARSSAGRPESTITGAGVQTNAAHAAWANGTLGHSAEFDDAHAFAWHAGSTVVSTAMAFAEASQQSGRDVITSVVAGSQIMSLLGAVAGPGMLQAGWHGSKVLGVFGAAAAAGKLLELGVEQQTNAFGIAASDAGGTMEYDQSGGEVKRLHAGSAARSGAESALLAQKGFTGPPTIFEGARGIFSMFGGAHDVSRLDEVWDHFHILDTIFRLYPTVATIHSPIAAVHHLATSNDFVWQQIDEIRVGLVDFAVGHGASITRPVDAISAQFSLAFSIGLQLVRGRNVPQDYLNPKLWVDKDILSVGDRVHPYAIPIDPGDPDFSSLVEIVLSDGRTLRHYERGFPGHPSNPASPSDVEVKFRANLEGLVEPDTANQFVKRVQRLELLDDVTPLTSLMGRPASG